MRIKEQCRRVKIFGEGKLGVSTERYGGGLCDEIGAAQPTKLLGGKAKGGRHNR